MNSKKKKETEIDRRLSRLTIEGERERERETRS